LPARLSPAEQRIAAAQRALEQHPESIEAWNQLAAALARRARETADPDYYGQAEKAVAESLRLAPDNFEGRKLRVWLRLGRHEFAAALAEAKELNRLVPDDVQVYGLLADAHVELGNYAAAEEAAQWMLDLRPGNVAGLTRGAYLRELFGDLEGALDFMRAAYQRTPAGESGDRAWLLTQMGHLELLRGNLETADSLLGLALDLFPDYHYALAQRARVRTVQGRHANAVALLRRHYEVAPHPENLFPLGEALKRAGETEEAARVFARFEEAALKEVHEADNANRELILYYVDHAGRPEEALWVAEHELASRRDVFTRDAYAWALAANDRWEEARLEIEAALAVGVRDPRILSHAGVISARCGSAHTR
jgi:tetratricopeptide (TPR) repeat protein